MSSYMAGFHAFHDQDLVSAEKNKPHKRCSRVGKAVAPATARGRGRPPKHTPYLTSPSSSVHSILPLSLQPRQRPSSPFRLPISKAVSQWNTARWRQLTMLTAKLKKESGGRVDKVELNKQLEIWETMVPKPQSPGDLVFLAMKPEPPKVKGSECASEQAQSATQQLSTLTRVGREDTPDKTELPYTSEKPYMETDCELVEWLLANLPSSLASHWYKSEKLCTSLPSDAVPTADYLSLQQERGLFQEESQISALLCTSDYESLGYLRTLT